MKTALSFKLCLSTYTVIWTIKRRCLFWGFSFISMKCPYYHIWYVPKNVILRTALYAYYFGNKIGGTIIYYGTTKRRLPFSDNVIHIFSVVLTDKGWVSLFNILKHLCLWTVCITLYCITFCVMLILNKF